MKRLWAFLADWWPEVKVVVPLIFFLSLITWSVLYLVCWAVNG